MDFGQNEVVRCSYWEAHDLGLYLACLPSNAYYPRTSDYTLCSGVHVCWSEHSDSSFVYGFMSLDYGFGTMTATTLLRQTETDRPSDCRLLQSLCRVAHQGRLRKLADYGIRGEVYQQIRSFLFGHTQQVVVDGESSYSTLLISGALQILFSVRCCFSSLIMTCPRPPSPKYVSLQMTALCTEN